MKPLVAHTLMRSKPRKSTPRIAETFSYIFMGFGIVLSLAALFFFSEVRRYALEIPTEEKIQAQLQDRGENSRIYDRNGQLLYTFKDKYRDREYADYSEIPPVIIASLLAAEDKDFFTHEGIDWFASIKGALITVLSSGENTIGGSTITQQLVKQTLLTSDQTVDRKIKEAMIALLVERDYSKEQILEYYVNVVAMGGRVSGIKTASHVYFNKDLSELTLDEAAFLVGLVQSPGEYSPIFAIDKENALRLSLERRNFILSTVSANHNLVAYLNSRDATYLKNTEATLAPANLYDQDVATEDLPFNRAKIEALKVNTYAFDQAVDELKAPHWVFYIRSLLSQAPYNLNITKLYTGGYNIYTTLDIRIQEVAQQSIKDGVDKYGNVYNFKNSGLVLEDSTSGEILAMVGSKGYGIKADPNDRRFDPQVNITIADQNLGSSLKPWVAYLAFNTGKFNANSQVSDSPQTFYGNYSPKNVDGQYFGNMTIHDALIESRNLPFLKLAYVLGDRTLPNFMPQIGYHASNDYGLAAAIGGVNENLLSHVSAYTGLANGGDVYQRRPILRITNRTGEETYKSESVVINRLNKGAVAEVNRILGDKSYTAGTYKYKFIGGQMLAGKTGTSDNNKDTYYIGYSPKVVAGVWVGNNDNTPMTSKALGSTTALLLWNDFMVRFGSQFPEYTVNGNY